MTCDDVGVSVAHPLEPLGGVGVTLRGDLVLEDREEVIDQGFAARHRATAQRG